MAYAPFNWGTGTDFGVSRWVNPHYDTVVVGGGQGGSLARMLAEGGQRVALVEKRFVGGSCTNVGCTPTKAHIAAAKIAHSIRTSGEFGIGAHIDRVDLGFIVERSQKIVEEFRRENEMHLLDTPGVELIYGKARFAGNDSMEVELRGGGMRTLRANTFVIAVGMKAQIPDVHGLRDVPFMTHVEALQLKHIPRHLLILGGGYIACEFAQMFARFGSQVTIVQNGKQLLPREDEDVATAVADVLRDSGIEIVLGQEVESVENASKGLVVQWAGEERSFSDVLVATGQSPQTKDLGLAGVEVTLDDEGFIQTDDSMKTSNPRIYALGDCKGGPQFTHIAYDDARILRDGLLRGQWRSIKDRPVPYTVFIDPQLGRIGLSEKEARQQGKDFGIAYLSMKDMARGIETGQTQGMWKILVERNSDQILGGAFLSGEGGETMAVVQMAMMAKMPYSVLRDGVFAHPTWAESLNNIFLRFDRQAKEREIAESSRVEGEERCYSTGAFAE